MAAEIGQSASKAVDVRDTLTASEAHEINRDGRQRQQETGDTEGCGPGRMLVAARRAVEERVLTGGVTEALAEITFAAYTTWLQVQLLKLLRSCGGRPNQDCGDNSRFDRRSLSVTEIWRPMGPPPTRPC